MNLDELRYKAMAQMKPVGTEPLAYVQGPSIEVIALMQTQATMEQTEQLKRIADALEHLVTDTHDPGWLPLSLLTRLALAEESLNA